MNLYRGRLKFFHLLRQILSIGESRYSFKLDGSRFYSYDKVRTRYIYAFRDVEEKNGRIRLRRPPPGVIIAYVYSEIRQSQQ